MNILRIIDIITIMRIITHHANQLTFKDILYMPKKSPLTEQKSYLRKAIDQYGTITKFATQMGVNTQLIYHWLRAYDAGNISKSVCPERCILIEKMTHGLVTRSQLRPDIFGDIPSQKLTTVQKLEMAISVAKDVLNDLSQEKRKK